MAGTEIDEIKNKLDIAEIVGDYVTLTKKGRNYWGCCPFHAEKTPSFCVSSDKQTFHCFGCGKGGDIFTFVMASENLSFREALERLAERAGVKLQSNFAVNRAQPEGKDILVVAQEFFRKSLNTPGAEPARAYLKRRNIDSEAAARFGIGWAPASWSALCDLLKTAGHSDKEICDSGLASQGTKGIYDRFRGRVMFPIYSASDKLIGFGGRIIDGDGAKYLNSPESPIFNKRNNLYLLNIAKVNMRQANSAILVEGYMDAIRAHLAGFTNTVASLGTSLTEQQAMLIGRMAKLCYICYDSDAAGQEAALRGMYIIQKQGISVRVVRLVGGKDPDEILQQPNGIEAFQKALNDALPLPVYHAVLRKDDIAAPEKSHEAREELLNGLASLSIFDLESYIGRVAEILGIFPHDLEEEIKTKQEIARNRGAKRKAFANPVAAEMPRTDQKTPAEQDVVDDLECILCSMLWENEDLRKKYSAEDVLPCLESSVVQTVIWGLLTGETPEELEKRWMIIDDQKSLSAIAKGNALVARDNIDKDSAAIILTALRKRVMKKRAKKLLTKLKHGTATDTELQEYTRLSAYLKGGQNGKWQKK